MLALPNCASLEIAKIRESASSEKVEALVSEQSRFFEVKKLLVPSSVPVTWGLDGGVFICDEEDEIPQKRNDEKGPKDTPPIHATAALVWHQLRRQPFRKCGRHASGLALASRAFRQSLARRRLLRICHN